MAADKFAGESLNPGMGGGVKLALRSPWLNRTLLPFCGSRCPGVDAEASPEAEAEDDGVEPFVLVFGPRMSFGTEFGTLACVEPRGGHCCV